MFPRAALVILALLLGAIVAIGVAFYVRGPFGTWRHQMSVGASYMKSIKGSDIPPWIERTQQLLAEWTPGSGAMVEAHGMGGKPIPADLQRLGIIRIDILENQVRYVWMGGMDHTELEVDRLPDGSFRFIAHYNDTQSDVIWPKGVNQAMEPTTGRCSAEISFTRATCSAFDLPVYVSACQSLPLSSAVAPLGLVRRCLRA